MAYLPVDTATELVTGLLWATSFSSPSRYLDATVAPYTMTSKQVVKGLLIVGGVLVVLLVLLFITWRMPSLGWLSLVLVLLIFCVTVLPLLGVVGYALSQSINASRFAEHRQLAEQLDREGIVVTSHIVKRWWGFVGGSEAASRLVAFESGPYQICQIVSKAFYQQIREGQAVQIRQLPKRPDVAQLAYPDAYD